MSSMASFDASSNMSAINDELSVAKPETHQGTPVQQAKPVRRGFEDSHLSDEFKITFWNKKHADSKGGVRTTIELAAEPRVAEHLFDMYDKICKIRLPGQPKNMAAQCPESSAASGDGDTDLIHKSAANIMTEVMIQAETIDAGSPLIETIFCEICFDFLEDACSLYCDKCWKHYVVFAKALEVQALQTQKAMAALTTKYSAPAADYNVKICDAVLQMLDSDNISTSSADGFAHAPPNWTSTEFVTAPFDASPPGMNIPYTPASHCQMSRPVTEVSPAAANRHPCTPVPHSPWPTPTSMTSTPPTKSRKLEALCAKCSRKFPVSKKNDGINCTRCYNKMKMQKALESSPPCTPTPKRKANAMAANLDDDIVAEEPVAKKFRMEVAQMGMWAPQTLSPVLSPIGEDDFFTGY